MPVVHYLVNQYQDHVCKLGGQSERLISGGPAHPVVFQHKRRNVVGRDWSGTVKTRLRFWTRDGKSHDHMCQDNLVLLIVFVHQDTHRFHQLNYVTHKS